MKKKKFVIIFILGYTVFLTGCKLPQLPAGVQLPSIQFPQPQPINVTINNNPTITSSPTTNNNPTITSNPTTTLTNEPQNNLTTNPTTTLTNNPNNSISITNDPTNTNSSNSNPTLTNTPNTTNTLTNGEDNVVGNSNTITTSDKGH